MRGLKNLPLCGRAKNSLEAAVPEAEVNLQRLPIVVKVKERPSLDPWRVRDGRTGRYLEAKKPSPCSWLFWSLVPALTSRRLAEQELGLSRIPSPLL